jgi:hypothetical protein
MVPIAPPIKTPIIIVPNDMTPGKASVVKTAITIPEIP